MTVLLPSILKMVDGRPVLSWTQLPAGFSRAFLTNRREAEYEYRRNTSVVPPISGNSAMRT
ncbi:MAG: hypothetical protein BWY99_01618 [Synergistetes bacterium ADurb.BinA166]|nr:MAG: hypothetical protein BWY99_01618 [Synergistetes bacterium ADurb.BinA166]